MTVEELLRQYPNKRLKPFNGMAITATIWEEAHEYHRLSQAMQTLFSHGAGILTGLQVIASDPADTTLYIQPGVAIDQAGQMIILPEAVAYDIGQEMEGLFYLVLSYGESHSRGNGDTPLPGLPTYVKSEFSLLAQPTLTDAPGVELARINRSSRNSVLRNAQHPVLPNLDEIDLRFRREVGAPPEVRIAVSYLGQVADPRQGVGVAYLAETLNHLGQYRVLVDDQVSLGPGIVGNTLVYLVGQGQFELSTGVMNGLRNYVYQGRGTLFLESLDDQAQAAFMNFLNSREMALKPIERGHPLLTRPYFFNTPPAGYLPDPDGGPTLSVGEGVILSRQNYGLIWQGERQDRLASWEEMRAAAELGANIVMYALSRKRG